MTMKPGVKRLREVVGHIPGSWVRSLGNDTFWVSASGTTLLRWSTRLGMEEVCKALTAAGITWTLDGKPGTSGEYLVTVTLSSCQAETKEAA